MAKGFDLSSMGDLVQQAQAMQERIARTQQEVGERVFEAAAGGGMVSARVNGRLELLSVEIDPQVVETGDRDMLQDLVVAAVNAAMRDARAAMAEEVSKLTGGLRIPGLG